MPWWGRTFSPKATEDPSPDTESLATGVMRGFIYAFRTPVDACLFLE
jgi:hypothetical protein